MNRYLKIFFHRGLIFAGFGSIIMGVVYFVLSKTLTNFLLDGEEVCIAVISTYMLAFIQAGASVFNQIERWPIAKSLLVHFATLYFAYVLCYLLNSWIPFEWEVVGIFTVIFATGYFLVCAIVAISIKATEKRLNRKLK